MVAEGIETTDQLAFFCRHACPQAQGFLISRPVDATAIGSMLKRTGPIVDIEHHPKAFGSVTTR